MKNPYRQRPPWGFWRKSVSTQTAHTFDPVTDVSITIGASDKVSTAGSCFAQHIARALSVRGIEHFITETEPASAGAKDQSYGIFSARYGNIYSVRQALQLIKRAYGLFEPVDDVWRVKGKYLDPFRPTIQEFSSQKHLRADRKTHLKAVRKMFEECDVFVFTLGLTERWESKKDGAVFPLAPGVVGAEGAEDDYRFHNASVAEMTGDLETFLDYLRAVNPKVKIILTVSPVALIATYTDAHVAVANSYSKAALRVVAEEVSAAFDRTVYFPSYEIITGPHTRSEFLASDFRDVTQEGVDRVMTIFCKHFLGEQEDQSKPPLPKDVSEEQIALYQARIQSDQKVICDEEIIEKSLK